ncbi:MAG: exosortase C-terminal domain/associated protein EpsI [Desulfobaccales bacterium]
MEAKTKSFSLIPLISAVVLLSVLVWSYWPILVTLIKYLYRDDDYSFGLLIPFVVAYIVHLKWPEIQQKAWQPSWLGLLIIGFGFCLYLFGEILTSVYIPCFSFVVVLAGLLFLVGGGELVRLMSFPLLLLFLMIPSKTLIIRQISLHLQLISSILAAVILNGLGVPVLRQGNILDLGVRQLQVVAACSGLRYILSLLTLGLIYCFFYQRRFWKAAFLIVSLIPAAIIANALRVAAMALVPALQEEGFWHEFTGWLIFIGCFGVLILINWILNSFWPEVQPAESLAGTSKSPATGSRSGKSLSPYLIAALALVMLLNFVPHRLAEAPAVPLLQSFDRFPLTLGPWQGKRNYLDTAILKVLDTKDYFDANYTGPQNKSVSLWIAYYGNLQEAEGLQHTPMVCMTGSGWDIQENKTIDLLPGKPVTYLLMQQGAGRLLVYYWFIQRGHWLPTENSTDISLRINSLWNRRADGALIRLTTPVDPDIESAKARLADYAKLVVPLLSKFIPN